MEALIYTLVTALGLIAGAIIGYSFFLWNRQRQISKTEAEAKELIQEATDEIEIKDLERQEKIQEIEENAWSKVQEDFLKLESHIQELEDLVDETKKKNDQHYSQSRQVLVENERDLKKLEQNLNEHELSFQKKQQLLLDAHKKYQLALQDHTGINPETAKDEIKLQFIAQIKQETQKFISEIVDEYQFNSESKAKLILDVALNRFARSYCSERGIGSVSFPDPQTRSQFCDPEGKNILAIQEACGCDLMVREESDQVAIAGFDPVRRELTRRTLERIFKEKKKINTDLIKKTAEFQKRELFKKIKQDGDAIAKELKLEGLHPEIRQMMGSLRYRYSFTQNQYFHCSEVGWLCGLLSSELNMNTKTGRRAGLLHDLGKSMDHAADGGHAVIGANFIQERGETPEIVHAVRAHHYDEQPNSDLAFLVIAADAISGARPGARRSTIESYNQKVTALQDIAHRYTGVTDAYVLSGGRELRVFVNSREVDDFKALEYSRTISKEIEVECSYPGQIKVVVVRETHAIESTTINKIHA